MGLAEEEVLIRDDSGLLLDTTEVRIPKSQAWRRKLTRTICLSLGFLVLGLCVAIPGPTLLDLEDQVKATTSQMMIVFASRSLGYLLGALLGGVLFDCFDKQLLLFCTLLISSVATVVIPWSLTLVVMATMFALQGITMGVLDTGGNVYCIQLWGKKNGPFIQTLHFAFGIGAFVAPLLARPFLSSATFTHNTTLVQGNIPVAPFLHEHHFQNMTRRSVTNIFEELEKFHRDISHDIDSSSVYNDNYRRLKRDLYAQDANANNLRHFDEIHSHIGVNTINKIVEIPSSDRILKREVNPADLLNPPQTGGSGLPSSNSEEEITPSPNVETSTPSKVSTKTPDNLLGDVKEVNTSSEDNANATSTSVKPVSVTIAATPTTSVEAEVVKKPTAVTDNNRDSSSADGQPLIKHLDDHKNEPAPELLPNPSPIVDTDSPVGSNDTEQDENTNNTNSMKPAELPANVTNSSTVKVNTSIVPATQKVNPEIPQSEVSTNPTAKSGSPANVPAVPTVKPDIDVTPDKNVINEKPTTVAPTPTTTTTPKPTTTMNPKTTTTTTFKPTTTTPKPTTTTPKPTTTMTPQTTTPTSTTPKPTTPKPTTTTSKTTTTTTEKTTTTTKAPPISVQEKTSTKMPATSREQSTIQPTDAKLSTTDASVVKTSTNSSVVNNTGRIQSTTEISKKPETTVDSFLNHAITAVKNISRIQFAYVIIGLSLFLIAIVFMVLYCRDKRRLSVSADFDELERFKAIEPCTKYSLIILLGMFFFSYMGLEVTFGALVTTFTVEYNHWPKEQGAVVAAIFWGSLATGRGMSIFISRCCGPSIMLALDLFLMIIGGLVLAVGIPYFDKLLWLGTLILGLGMSSAFPAGISWAESRFHLTGKTTAVFVTGSAIGQMVIPLLTGFLYEKYGAMSLMYITVVLTIVTLLMFILMQCVSFKSGSTLKVNARNGFLPLEDEDDDTLEMGDLVHFDKSQTRTLRDRRSRGDAEYHTLISDLDDD